MPSCCCALDRGDRAVIADPDACYLKRFYDAGRGDIILNPFEQRSLKWDPFAELRAPYDAEQLARSLIPDHEGADRSWRAYARTFFTAVMQQTHAAGIRNVGELYRLLVVADTAELRALTQGTPAQPFMDEYNVRMFDSIRSVTSSAVAALDHIAGQRAQPFSVREWVDRAEHCRSGVLFIPYRAGQIAALRSMISAWMRIGIFQAMEYPEGDQRLWFVVDELDALGHIDGLKDALARLRKFGGRCVLGFQSVAQVTSNYGVGDAHTIVENCGNSLILRCSASEGGGTARFASTLIGQREVTRTSTSRSRRLTELFGSTTRSEYLNIEPAVMDSQIEQLPDLAGYLKLASRREWLRVRLAVAELTADRYPLSERDCQIDGICPDTATSARTRNVPAPSRRARSGSVQWSDARGYVADDGRLPAMNRPAVSRNPAIADRLQLEVPDDDTRLGLLLDAAHRNQQLVDASLDRLDSHTRGLDAVVRDEIRRTFVSECRTLEQEIASATAALQRMQRMANLRLACWSIAMMTMAAGAIALILDRVLPTAPQLNALRAQRDQLAVQIQQLTNSGARIDLRRCGNDGRLCVRVDKSAPSYGVGGDYLILKGH